jgi:hypothetical protein
MSMFTSFWNKYGETITKETISIAKGAAVAAVGAVATYGIREIGNIDMGEYSEFVGAFLAIIANALRKVGVPVIAAVSRRIAINFV